MEIVSIKNLSKHYKVLNHQEGLLGSIKDLFSRDYRYVQAVNDISMSIQEGDIIGFLGPNGAGKSTTIKMMTGVLKPSKGDIWINGFVPFQNQKKYLQNIGVVFGQRTQLWWDLPVIESFKILKEIYRVDQKTYNNNMDFFQELVDLEPLYLTPVRNLSLGQRMLCDIVAAFLHDPKIIFFDEPTIGLDISVKSKIRKIIQQLNKKKKTTIILTSHDIGDVEALCKRIILIDKGKLLYDGDILKFNQIFGTFRRVTIELDTSPEVKKIHEMREGIKDLFPTKNPLELSQKERTICLTFNQEEIKLVELLEFVGKELPMKDLKVEEIQMENVVQKIYEGALG